MALDYQRDRAESIQEHYRSYAHYQQGWLCRVPSHMPGLAGQAKACGTGWHWEIHCLWECLHMSQVCTPSQPWPYWWCRSAAGACSLQPSP
jgi:hypothetical protein